MSPAPKPCLGVRQRHDRLAAEVEVEMALVAEMFDPRDGCRHVSAAARDRQVLGARADGLGAGGAPANRAAGSRLIVGWPSRAATWALIGFS